ncbi:MAG: hypothetical protein Kow0077_25110 [Anaerolineae bacterium]
MVALWDAQHKVHYFNLFDATPSGERKFDVQQSIRDLDGEFWREFVSGLQAPNDAYLPTVLIAGLTLYQSRDGRLRLYHFHDGSLIMEVDSRHVGLNQEQSPRILIAGLDRALGLCAAIDEHGLLHLFQQHIPVGTYELGLKLGVDARLNLHLPDGLGRLLVSDGEHVMLVDSAGRVVHSLHAHFAVGPVAISPEGQYILLGDIDDNVVRVYDSELRPTHQKHAIDLIATARQVQLIASLPGRKAGLSALDISDRGTIVFALGGVVCVTELKALDVLPQPRPLL